MICDGFTIVTLGGSIAYSSFKPHFDSNSGSGDRACVAKKEKHAYPINLPSVTIAKPLNIDHGDLGILIPVRNLFLFGV